MPSKSSTYRNPNGLNARYWCSHSSVAASKNIMQTGVAVDKSGESSSQSAQFNYQC